MIAFPDCIEVIEKVLQLPNKYVRDIKENYYWVLDARVIEEDFF